MEMAAPRSTPLTGPDPRTPSSAAIDTKNSARLKRQMCFSAAHVDQAHDGRQHDRRQHRLRQIPQQARGEQHDDEREERRDQSGQRRAGPGALVDERLRHAAADGEPAAEPGQQIAGAERQELLVGVETVAVLLREHAADGRRLDGAEHEARERQRQERVELVPADVRQARATADPAEPPRAARRPRPRGPAAGRRRCSRRRRGTRPAGSSARVCRRRAPPGRRTPTSSDV